jgi:hypothetical protein
MPYNEYEQLKGRLIYLPHYVLNIEIGFDIFFINVGVQVNLHAFRIISRALKLTTM